MALALLKEQHNFASNGCSNVVIKAISTVIVGVKSRKHVVWMGETRNAEHIGGEIASKSEMMVLKKMKWMELNVNDTC
jgi:hypothetical protein